MFLSGTVIAPSSHFQERVGNELSKAQESPFAGQTANRVSMFGVFSGEFSRPVLALYYKLRSPSDETNVDFYKYPCVAMCCEISSWNEMENQGVVVDIVHRRFVSVSKDFLFQGDPFSLAPFLFGILNRSRSYYKRRFR